MAAESRKTIRCGSETDSQPGRGVEAERGGLFRAAGKLAQAQHNVLALDHLREVGLSDPGVRHWVAAGRLHRKHHGVYAFGRPDLTANGRRMAAVLACGDGAVVSHAAAGALHGIRSSDVARIDITLPAGAPLRRHEGIRCRRAALAPQDVTTIDGIPVTSLARTLLDLASLLSDAALERAANQAVINGLFDMRAVEDLLGRARGKRGVRRLRRVLGRGDLSGLDMPKSGLEVRFAKLCAGAGLPKPEINRYLLLSGEYHQVDFLWRRHMVVIETDGARYHSTGWQLERDARRDELLSRNGYRHARIDGATVADEPWKAVSIAEGLLKGRESKNDPRRIEK